MRKWRWLWAAALAFLLAGCSAGPGRVQQSASETDVSVPETDLPASGTNRPVTADSKPGETGVMTTDEGAEYTVEGAVSKAILTENQNRYLEGECEGEGHKILEVKEDENQVTAYTLAMYGWYQFQDGNFVKNSGSGVIPAVVIFEKEEDGAYSLKSYETAKDGSLFVPSIKEMFPEGYWEICISPTSDIMEDLRKQEREYASAYLKKIGREAKIGDYGDFEHTILTEAGVSVEVSNRMSGKEGVMMYCPFWIGNVERVEDGVRYRYETAFDPRKKEIIYSRTNMETNVVVEEDVFSSENGNFLRHRNVADKSASPFEAALNSLEGVAMEAVKGSATPVSVELTLQNGTDRNIIYGESYELQKYSDGQWWSVPYTVDNWVFNDVAYNLSNGVPGEITVDWEAFHGTLEPGRYRVIKDVLDFRGTGDFTKYYLGAEFDIGGVSE